MAQFDSTRFIMIEHHSPEIPRPGQTMDRDRAGALDFVVGHRSFFALVLVVAAQLLLLSLQITRNHNVRLIRYWAVEAFDPFERSLGGLVDFSSSAYRTYGRLWHAQQENQELRFQLVAAQTQIHQLSEQAGESQRLRGLLDFKNQLGYQAVAAEVIASSPGESSNAVFIDKGSDSGLKTNLAVITPEGIVGKIVAIFPHSAQVLLIVDPNSGVGVTMAQSRVQGILKGGTDSFCDVNYIMNEEAVSPGEAVLTSGLDQIYPKGLAVGTVVSAGNANIYKNISVKPAVDLNRLEMVLVVLQPEGTEQQAVNLSPRAQ